ncbi:mechanosensitive ion channel family protein [Micromonospora sp. HK10]|uniref:mechanosensitive ion channel family protein n=1 Tax=Micromonospora sp. HK10 TaxID=1538294 RepID=UPI000697048B|nr:mechanosensitive ion channel domain-containing protein [Micromonospora sp. HK10]
MITRTVLAVAVAVVVAAGMLAGVLVQRRAGRRYGWLLAPLYRASRVPAVAVLLLAALYAGLRAHPDVRRVVFVLLIASVAWLVLRALHVAERVAFSRLPGQTRADRRVRRARTQIRPVRRLTSVVVTVAAIGLILTTFPALRTIGLSVLTSAGVVGALLGLSARTALGNAFAGIQVAFADGLHVGDVIVVDGQWGRVEEVKLTNVVIRLWDDRMLILPTTWFTEHPFRPHPVPVHALSDAASIAACFCRSGAYEERRVDCAEARGWTVRNAGQRPAGELVAGPDSARPG